MAYLSPKNLTCPSCGTSGTVTWVIGIGPGSKRGDKPYKKLHNSGPFVQHPTQNDMLLCPNCDADIPKTAQAEDKDA